MHTAPDTAPHTALYTALHTVVLLKTACTLVRRSWLCAGVCCLLQVLPQVANAKEFDKLLLSEDVQQLTLSGLGYQHGRGVVKNMARAIQYLCTAAKLNHSPAQYELGWLYMNRRHGRRDDAQAAAWLQKAAAQGDNHAHKLLSHVAAVPAAEAGCPLPDGSEYRLPLKSKANPSTDEIVYWVERLAPEYDLSPQLVIEVIRAESNFNVKAQSHKQAKGLMQLIPRTAKRFGVENIWDPLQNIRGGMAYLRWLLDHFDEDVTLALAGYNAGEDAVKTYRGVPPYRETRHYVKLITQRLETSRGI